MSPRLSLTTAWSNFLRLTLAVAAAAALSAGVDPAPAGAQTVGAQTAAAKVDGQRSDRVVATASATKRRSVARKVRPGQRPAKVKGRAAGRKVG